MSNTEMDKENVRAKVREGYAQIARAVDSSCGCGCCGSTQTSDGFAESIGYSAQELAALPEGANMALSCGNPTAMSSLKPGEIVLDLGCGGGFDVFIAAGKVGQQGRVIGVDMTAEMLAKARANADVFSARTGLNNVEFRLGEIEHLPVADAGVDVVISNCVINLSPDKPQVWREAARVLKPGGRVAVSDLALLRPLPEAIKKSVTALVGCVAGAVLVSETEGMLRDAGFEDIELEKHADYIDAHDKFQDPLYSEIAAEIPAGMKMSDYVVSLYVTALKPE